MKSLINTVLSSLKTRFVEPPTDGRGEGLPLSPLELNVVSTNVEAAYNTTPTNKSDWITYDQWLMKQKVSKDGINTANVSSVEQVDFKSYAPNVTQLRPEEKMNGGKKYDSEKPAMALLSPKGLEEEAKGMTYGAKKYGPYNWRKGIAVSRYISATLRHLTAVISGELVDPESGVSHLGHAKCNIGMAIQTLEDHPELNDLYKKE